MIKNHSVLYVGILYAVLAAPVFFLTYVTSVLGYLDDSGTNDYLHSGDILHIGVSTALFVIPALVMVGASFRQQTTRMQLLQRAALYCPWIGITVYALFGYLTM